MCLGVDVSVCVCVCTAPKKLHTHTEVKRSGRRAAVLPPTEADRPSANGQQVRGGSDPTSRPTPSTNAVRSISLKPRVTYVYIYTRNFTLSLARSLSLSHRVHLLTYFCRLFALCPRRLIARPSAPERTPLQSAVVSRPSHDPPRHVRWRSFATTLHTVTYARLLPSPTASRERKGQDLTRHGVQ